jgi:hypothetical protein
MRSEEFQRLDQFDQNIILWEKATIIGERQDAVYKYILYQLNNFYIEVQLTISNLREVIRTFSGDKQLEPYLQGIELNDLKGIVGS